MKKVVVLFILITLVSMFMPVYARTVRKDRPVRLVNPQPYSRHCSHYRVGRGTTRRCNGSCHREDEQKTPVYSYKPVQSNSKYAYGTSINRVKTSDVPKMEVIRYRGTTVQRPIRYTIGNPRKTVVYSYSAK